jgi:hypothetical protein
VHIQDTEGMMAGAVRNPVNKAKGVLHDVLPVEYSTHSSREVLSPRGIDPALVDDLIARPGPQVGAQAVRSPAT